MPGLSTDDVFGSPAKPASGLSTADVFGGPTSFGEESTTGKTLKRGAKNVASVIDMVAGLPGQALGVGADLGGRLSALLHGGSASDMAWAGKAYREAIPEALTAPISKTMKVFGSEHGLEDSDVSGLMAKAMGLVSRGGQWVEEKTGKVLRQQDVESLVNTALFAAGGRGTAAAVDPRLKAMGRFKEDPKTLQAKLEAEAVLREEQAKLDAENAPIQTSTGRVIPRVDKPTPMRASTPEEMKTLEKQERKVLRQKEKDVRAAFAEDPVYADQLEGRADLADQAREMEGRHTRRDVLQATGERTRAPERTAADDAAKTLEQNEFGDLSVKAPSALESGLDKVSRGRSFDLTAQEKAAINSSKSEFNRPKLYHGKERGAIDLKAIEEGVDFKNLAERYNTLTEDAAAMMRNINIHAPDSAEQWNTVMAVGPEMPQALMGHIQELKAANYPKEIIGKLEEALDVAREFKSKRKAGDFIKNLDDQSRSDLNLSLRAEAKLDKLTKARDEILAKHDLENAWTPPNKPTKSQMYWSREASKLERQMSDLDFHIGQPLEYIRSVQKDGFPSSYAKEAFQYLDRKGLADLLGEGEVTGDNVVKFKPREAGKADPELLQKIGVIGGGAALAAYLSGKDGEGESTAGRNASLTAAVLGIASYAKSKSPAVRDLAESAGRGAEYGLGLVSTRIGNMSKPLLHRMREHERGVLTSTHDNLEVVAPFLERLAKVPAKAKEELNAAILTNDNAKVLGAMGKAGDPTLVREWKAVRAKLEEMGKGLVTSGRLKELLPDYYPRVVTDVPGLLEALGKTERTFLEKKLEDARISAMRKDGRDLSPLEQSQIVNKVLRQNPQGGRMGHLKNRSVEEISPELAKFYAPAEESLPLYIRAVSRELERAKFFGDDLVRDPEGGLANIDLSIGNVVNKELASGKIEGKQAEELRLMLQSRFGPGERGSAGPIQLMKNLTNAGLLGNVASALVQGGDIAISIAQQGIMPTIKALQQIATNSSAKITMKDLGLINHVTEEVSGGSKNAMKIGGMEVSSAKFLDKVFRWSGFTLIDQLGKSTAINAAANRFRRLSQTEKGRETIARKYKDAYGDEFPQLIKDLQGGGLTENVKGMLFSELSDIQPITKLEVPQAYLDMPNGRAVYMLKTYMLKQADIVRREGIQEIKAGNVSKGTQNLLRYATALGIGGATTEFLKNWLLGRENNEVEWADLTENVMKTFGWSQYVVDQARKGKPIQAFGGVVLPPYKMWDELLSRDPKAINYLPFFGRIIYGREMGGSEKADARAEKRKEKEE